VGCSRGKLLGLYTMFYTTPTTPLIGHASAHKFEVSIALAPNAIIN